MIEVLIASALFVLFYVFCWACVAWVEFWFSISNGKRWGFLMASSPPLFAVWLAVYAAVRGAVGQ